MKTTVICSALDDSTVEILRNCDTIVIHIEGTNVVVINPSILIDDCPLVTYCNNYGQMHKFNEIIGDICRNSQCESFFSSDTKKHMTNGYPVKDDKMLKDKITHIAKFTYNTWLYHRDKDHKGSNIEQTYFDV